MNKLFWMYLVIANLQVGCSSADNVTEAADADLALQQTKERDTQNSAVFDWRAPELTAQSYRMQSGNVPCPEASDELTYLDPMKVIPDLARQSSVVMINESHSKSVHRVFIGHLASILNQEGYKNFGSELFGRDKTQWLNSKLQERGYLEKGSSLFDYWSDPVFGQVVEDLVSQGLTLFSYEPDTRFPPEGTKSQVDFREQGQAENIHRHIQSYPDERFLIHGGYAHMKEQDNSSQYSWMAERFIQISGIDPLTISQTVCYLTSPIPGNFLGYGLMADGAGKPISKDGFDLIIAAPMGEYYKQRPIWLRDELDRRFVGVPESLRFDQPEDFTLVLATNLDRPADAPHEDFIYRHPNSDKVLALRPGRYNVTVTGRDEEIRAEAQIAVQ